MNTLDLLCMGCFTRLYAPDAQCHVCGYVLQRDDEGQHRLSPRTVLSGKYMVGKALGEGGFGITYLGYDLNLDIRVAIKEFYPFGFVTRSATQSTTVQPLAGEQGEFFLKGRERFVDEAKRLAKFRMFPGIVMVNDFFVENGTAYIVMEYVEGETLKSYIAQQGGRLPADMVFAMMKPVFESLSQMHAEGLIHRDISPDNIMVTHDGSVKLLDFGAAREFGEDGSKSLSVMLKHGYAPPEQYTSRGVQGPHTDVYALCATIYKAVTGVTPDGSMDRVMNDRLASPSMLGAQMPYHAEVAIMHGLAVKAEHRWQTVGELYAALYNAECRMQNAELGYNQGVQQTMPQQPAYDGRQVAAPMGVAAYPTTPQTAYQQPVGGSIYGAPQSIPDHMPQMQYGQENNAIAQERIPPIVPDPSPYSNAYIMSSSEKPKKSGNRKVILISVIAVLCALGIALAITLPLSEDGGEDPRVNNLTPSPTAEVSPSPTSTTPPEETPAPIQDPDTNSGFDANPALGTDTDLAPTQEPDITPTPPPMSIFIENPKIIITSGYDAKDRAFTSRASFANPVIEAGGIPILPTDDDVLADILRNGDTSYADAIAEFYDGLILTGGGDISARFFGQSQHFASSNPDENRDIAEIALCQAFIRAGKPVLGVNRGMQVINVAMGGDLIQDIPDLLGIDKNIHSGENTHTIQIEPNSWLHKLFGSSLTVNSSHHQCIGVLAEGFTIAAYYGAVIEAIENGNILGFQFNQSGLADGVLSSIYSDFIDRCKYYTIPG